MRHIILSYLQRYERDIINLLEGGPTVLSNYELSRLCALNNWPEAFSAFKVDPLAIIEGALENDHNVLFSTLKITDENHVCNVAARYGRLNILKMYKSYSYSTLVTAVRHCQIECYKYIHKTLYPMYDPNQGSALAYIDHASPRSLEMLLTIGSTAENSEAYISKKMEIATYHGDINNMKICGLVFQPSYVTAIAGGHIAALELSLLHQSEPFLVLAAQYNRIDMMQLAIKRGERDFDVAALMAAKHNRVDALALLKPHITNAKACYEEACQHGAYDVVMLLQEYATSYGLHLAKLYKHEEIVELVCAKFLL